MPSGAEPACLAHCGVDVDSMALGKKFDPHAKGIKHVQFEAYDVIVIGMLDTCIAARHLHTAGL